MVAYFGKYCFGIWLKMERSCLRIVFVVAVAALLILVSELRIKVWLDRLGELTASMTLDVDVVCMGMNRDFVIVRHFD